MTDTDTDRIDLSVPLRSEFSSMLRTVASSIGADLGLDLDQIDDLRLAVSETFSVLLERATSDDGRADGDAAGHGGLPPDRCHATFSVGPDAITIELGSDATVGRPVLDELAEAILSTVVDEHRLSEDGVVLVKRVVASASTS